jgi:drug/metabolite transporter (DMT)-like permease
VGVSTLLLSLVFQEPWNLTPSVNVWGWLLASVFIGTSLRFFIQTWAQGNTTVSKAALMMTLEPVWAAIIALYWFDETMSLVQLLGCTLIFIALVISRMPSVKGMWRGVRKIMGSSN